MIEFLFLIAFSLVLVFTGVSMIGVLLAVAAGFAIMAVAGMIGIVFKLLPWIALIAVVVWFYREKKQISLTARVRHTAAVTNGIALICIGTISIFWLNNSAKRMKCGFLVQLLL